MKKTIHQDQNLISRLSGYAASAGALLALVSETEAQVAYSGIQEIDLNTSSSIFELDLNGDAITDFLFMLNTESTFYTYTDPFLYVRYVYGYGGIMNARTDAYKNSWMYRSTAIATTYTNSGNVYTSVNTYPIVDGLVTGVKIDDWQSYWKNPSTLIYSGMMGAGYLYSMTGSVSDTYGFSIGDFINTERYIGVRFYIANNQHYGWIRAFMDYDFRPLTIVDWAYEETPGDAISAGSLVSEGPEAFIEAGVSSTNIKTINISLSFNERVYNFDLNALQTTNGSANDLVETIPGKEFNFNITAANEGPVSVTLPAGSVTDLQGNENLAASDSWIYSGMLEINDQESADIQIYPNPVSDKLFIKIPSESSINIFDINGQLVFACEEINEQTIDVSNFKPGIYIIHLIGKETITQHKIVVE